MYIHDRIITATGGSGGLKDEKLLQSICEKPKTMLSGKEQYASVYEKAAVLAESFSKFHVFVDGNKRIAIATAARFLYINGRMLKADNTELENFTVSIIENDLPVKEIANWLKQHSVSNQ